MAQQQKRTQQKPQQQEPTNGKDETGQALVPVSVGQIIDKTSNFSNEEKALVKATYAKDTTDMQFALFLAVADSRKLSPLAGQIHAVVRNVKQRDNTWAKVMTIQTGIDGFRSIADRTRCYAPSDKGAVYGINEAGKLEFVTVWVKKFAQGIWHEYPSTAYFREFCPREKRDNEWVIPFMWEKMPINQLEKCAEAKALRRGFPTELGGLYIDEEMHRADSDAVAAATGTVAPDADTPQVIKPDKSQRARGSMRASTSENRGHGEEGTQQAQHPEPEKGQSLAVMDTTVENVSPRTKKLTPEQEKANAALKKQGKQPQFEPQPFFELKCSGDILLYVFDQHLFKAIIPSRGKKLVGGVEKREKDGKTFYALKEIASIDDAKYGKDANGDVVPLSEIQPGAQAASPEPENQAKTEPTEKQLFDQSTTRSGEDW